jgi:formate hydrogenlyase subunit 3/multisubunit Na+/H+ antiporter MnhD subunit
VTDAVPILVALVPAVPLLGAALTLLARSAKQADRFAVAAAFPTAAAALILAGIVLARGGRPALHGHWYLADGASALLLAVIAVTGLCSTLVSPPYLRTSGRSLTTVTRSHNLYYGALFVF